MQKTDIPDHNFKTYEALVIGLVLAYALQWNNPINAIALFDFYPEFITEKVVVFLMTLVWLLVLFQKKFFKSLIALIVSAFALVSIFRYSSNFAFRYFILYILGFLYIFSNQDKKLRAIGSSLILGALFLFSAFHKINADYLSGVEFERGGTFISFIDLWFSGITQRELSPLMKYLPHFSIILEFIIAFGLLLRPRLFIHVAGFFLLILCIVHPPVLNVYFMLLPLFICISSGYENLLEKLPFSHLLKTPYFWAFYIFISTSRIHKLFVIFLSSYIFVLIFFMAHVLVLLSYKKEDTFLFKYNQLDFKNTRIWIIPLLMGLTFIGSLSVLPGPFGFKMFSGRRFETRYLDLSVLQREACISIPKRWQFSPVTDVSWRMIDGHSCQILLPTKGSVHYVARHICRDHSFSEFSLKTSTNDEVIAFNCSDYIEKISSKSL